MRTTPSREFLRAAGACRCETCVGPDLCEYGGHYCGVEVFLRDLLGETFAEWDEHRKLAWIQTGKALYWEGCRAKGGS